MICVEKATLFCKPLIISKKKYSELGCLTKKFTSHIMYSGPNLSFGSHWEVGIEVEHRVNTYKYWNKKLKHEIMRSLTLRDRKSLSELVKYCVLLRDINRGTNISSSSVVLLFSSVALITAHEQPFIELMNEFLYKLPKTQKTYSYRLLLNAICKKYNYQKLLKTQVTDVTNKSASENYIVQDLSELRITASLLHNVDDHIQQKLNLLKIDPTIDLPLRGLIPHLTPEYWIYLVNRVDKLPNDFESWEVLDEFMNIHAIDDPHTVNEIKSYVNGYWPLYHLPIEVAPDVKIHRDNVFNYLS